MLDPRDYTYLVSEMTVTESDGLTLVTLPRPVGDMAYFRWRWVCPPIADVQIAKSVELALDEAVRGRMVGGDPNVPTGKVKFQVLIDAVVATGRCAPAGLATLLSALASCVARTMIPSPPVTPLLVAPAERARRHVQVQAAGLLSCPPTLAESPPAWHGQALSPSRSTLCIVGDFGSQALQTTLSVLQGSPPQPPTAEDLVPQEPPQPTFTVIEAADSRVADVVMGQRVPPRGTPLGAAADLALTALAGAHRSDLNVTLREDHRLTYGVQSSVTTLAGTSMYTLRYSVPTAQAQQALTLTRTAIESLRKHGVSPQRLSDLQTLRTGALVVSLDTSEGLCACLASLHLPGNQGDLIEYLRSYQSVTTDDLAAAFDASFDPERMHVAVATYRRTALDWRTHG